MVWHLPTYNNPLKTFILSTHLVSHHKGNPAPHRKTLQQNIQNSQQTPKLDTSLHSPGTIQCTDLLKLHKAACHKTFPSTTNKPSPYNNQFPHPTPKRKKHSHHTFSNTASYSSPKVQKQIWPTRLYPKINHNLEQNPPPNQNCYLCHPIQTTIH